MTDQPAEQGDHVPAPKGPWPTWLKALFAVIVIALIGGLGLALLPTFNSTQQAGPPVREVTPPSPPQAQPAAGSAPTRPSSVPGSPAFGGKGGAVTGGGEKTADAGGTPHPKAAPKKTTKKKARPALPDFPWPPPAASANYVLPRDVFPSDATVGQVATAILTALQRNGYVERSFFRTEADGVALVTRIEQIDDDGYPLAIEQRWPSAFQGQASVDLVRFLRGLFYVEPGRYRVIVFILQEQPFWQSDERVTGDEARGWLRTGANVLPRDVAERPFGDGNCTALIYEFASDGVAVRVIDSRLTGLQHLERSGILPLSGKPN